MLILQRNEESNTRFLDELKAMDHVELQTRFIVEERADLSRLKLWSYEPIDDRVFRDRAAATGTTIITIERE